MLANYLRSALGVKYTDTATILSGYTRNTNALKYTDTASMLSNRLKISDTTNMLANYLRINSNNIISSFSAGNTGLTPASATNGAITLGGTLSVSNGGTGVTSLTALAASSAFNSTYIPYTGATGPAGADGAAARPARGGGAGGQGPARSLRRSSQAPSLLSKFCQKKACFLQIFANFSLAVYWDFKGLEEEKNFLRP